MGQQAHLIYTLTPPHFPNIVEFKSVSGLPVGSLFEWANRLAESRILPIGAGTTGYLVGMIDVGWPSEGLLTSGDSGRSGEGGDLRSRLWECSP